MRTFTKPWIDFGDVVIDVLFPLVCWLIEGFVNDDRWYIKLAPLFFYQKDIIGCSGIMGLFYWDMIPGSLKKQPSCHTHCEETCVPPSPNSMLLRRFAWKGLQNKNHFGSDAGMHWAATLIKGAQGGSGVMWQHVGGWLFFWRTRYHWPFEVSTEVHTICRVYVRWYITKVWLDMVQSLHFRYPKWSLIMYWLTSLPDLTNDNFFGESFPTAKKCDFGMSYRVGGWKYPLNLVGGLEHEFYFSIYWE